jgi:hypothetical protein
MRRSYRKITFFCGALISSVVARASSPWRLGQDARATKVMQILIGLMEDRLGRDYPAPTSLSLVPNLILQRSQNFYFNKCRFPRLTRLTPASRATWRALKAKSREVVGRSLR